MRFHSNNQFTGRLLLAQALSCAFLAASLCTAQAQGAPPAPPHFAASPASVPDNAPIKPAVAAIVNEATAAYSKMQSYQHTAEVIERNSQNAILMDKAYTLAIDRPNKFCYRSEDSSATAAISNGSVFINFSGQDQTYVRTAAPSSLNKIDIVNGVNFDAVGTYLVALMLQNRPLADPAVRSALVQASNPTVVKEGGVQYDTFSAPLVPDSPPAVLYFNADTHLLHKVVIPVANSRERTVEVLEDVRINKPVPDSLFQYTPPKGAHWII